jgi:lysophospholipase L1-like esterase
MRICFWGDSFVNGTGDDDGLGWVGRVVARARRAGRDVTAYNLGIRGNTSADVAARWKGEAELRLVPEHDGRLVFSFGANDGAPGVDGRPRVERAASLANAETILGAAHGWLPTLMIGPAPIADDRAANARLRALSTGYAKLCQRIAVPYLDIFELLLASPTWIEEARAGDGAHPNRGGYAIVAAAVSEWTAWRAWVGDFGEPGGTREDT